jgi:hypothetical protein
MSGATSARRAQSTGTVGNRRPPEPLSRSALEVMQDHRTRPADIDALQNFMMTDRTERLFSQLLRYCEGKQDGVSILIAGTRGAGKTTLAKLVIQRLIIDGRGMIPLPIILHGPTLLRESVGAEQTGSSAPYTWTQDDSDKAADEEARKVALKRQVLRGLIAALYRHLSDAITDSWKNAVAPGGRPVARHVRQLAAHLELKLEDAPSAATLRKIWLRAGLLRRGAAPHLYPIRLARSARRDSAEQGLHEIVALATCAHSYLTIVGEAKEKLSRETAQATRSGGGGADIGGGRDRGEAAAKEAEKPKEPQRAEGHSGREQLGQFVPPALATVATSFGLLQERPVWAVAAGLTIWLLGVMSSRFTERRDQLSELRRNLTIDVDWTERRLERELPVLLERVKRAGFAPIFVLDELDKLETQSETLGRFLDLTKHIVRDQAAFLFLTNRDYFEQLTRQIRPLEIAGDVRPLGGIGPRGPQESAASTYYEHRVFMLYTPENFRRYFAKVAVPENWNSEAMREFDVMAWATVLVYQARKEPFAFNENLNRIVDEDGLFRDKYKPVEWPLTDPIYPLQLTMQLGLEMVADAGEIDRRIDQRPSEAQLMFDALYYVAELHALDREADKPFAISIDSLGDYLRRRAESDRTERLPDDFPTPAQRRFVFGLLHDYLNLLAYPESIRRAVRDKGERQSQQRDLWVRLARMVVSYPIVETAAGDDNIEFKFLVDRYATRPGTAAQKLLSLDAVAAYERWRELLESLLGDSNEMLPAVVPILEGFSSLNVATLRVLSSGSTELQTAQATMAAEQLEQYLQMLERWRDCFLLGMIAVLRASLVVPELARTSPDPGITDWPRRRLTALGALARIGVAARDEPPVEIARRLSIAFADPSSWPESTRSAVTDGFISETAERSFADSPAALTEYCYGLRTYATRIEQYAHAMTIDLPAIWSAFWAQWVFQQSAPRVRRTDGADGPNPTDLLHAAYHGGLPVIAPTGGSPSIGEWCRLLTLYRFSREKVPLAAAEAALAVLGLAGASADFGLPPSSGSVPPIAPGGPILLIYLRSIESQAWTWQPRDGVRAVVQQPLDVLAADRAATDKSAVDAFAELLRQSDRRAVDVVHCVEVGANFENPPRFGRVAYFGSGAAPGLHLGEANSVGELMARVLTRFALIPTSTGYWSRIRRLLRAPFSWRRPSGPARE